jgi:hypothetical protein
MNRTHLKISKVGWGERSEPQRILAPLLGFGPSCLNPTYIKTNFETGSNQTEKLRALGTLTLSF